jgi:hypothetical protein
MRDSLQMGKHVEIANGPERPAAPCRIGKILRGRPEGTNLGLGWLLTPKKC